jgi:hypothetical protein
MRGRESSRNSSMKEPREDSPPLIRPPGTFSPRAPRARGEGYWSRSAFSAAVCIALAPVVGAAFTSLRLEKHHAADVVELFARYYFRQIVDRHAAVGERRSDALTRQSQLKPFGFAKQPFLRFGER